MAPRKLKLMISSRSDAFGLPDGQGGEIKLREIRTTLKRELETAEFLGNSLLKVWINETEHGNQTEIDWDECLIEATECDLFIALYDGNAGWERDKSGLGICQAEFDAAFNTAPQKVQIVRLPNAKLPNPVTEGATRYLDALTRAHRFETHIKKDWPELQTKIKDLVRNMVLRTGLEGARQFRKSGANVGQALDWTRMDFNERSDAIKHAIALAVGRDRTGRTIAHESLRELEGQKLLFVCHGAPRSMAEAAGREAVGRPFFSDHHLVAGDTGATFVGPVHLIGCPKGVTDLQAITLLGTPDITVVPGSFGVYAVDRVNMVQVCLLADCADSGSTRNAVARLFEWLERSGEQRPLVKRAAARRRILDVIADELKG
jgi:hypothetical protein